MLSRMWLIAAGIVLSLVVILAVIFSIYTEGTVRAIAYIIGGGAIIIGINGTNILSERMKEVSSLIISITSISGGVTEYNTTIIERTTRTEVVKEINKSIFDSMKVEIFDSMKAGEGRLMASQEELKRLLTQLDSSAVHRDSLSAKIDSVDKHITRHFDFMYPRVKEIQENVKKE